MIEIWVLILFMKAGYAGAAISQEFNSKQECEIALDYFKSNWLISFKGECFKK